MYQKVLSDYFKIALSIGLSLLIWFMIKSTDVKGSVEVANDFIYFVQLGIFVFYYMVLIYYSKGDSVLNKNKILLILLINSIVFVSLIKYSFYLYNGTLLEYTSADSYYYDLYTREIISGDIVTGIRYLFNELEYSDWGFFIYTTLVYSIYPSEIMLSFANILISLVAANFLYELVRRVLPQRLTGLTILIIFMSSYFLYYQASGLKEIFFVTVVLGFFYRAQLLYERPGLINFVVLILFALPIALLRPPVLVFGMIAISIVYIRSIFKNPFYAILLVIVMIFLGLGFAEITNLYSRFFPSIDDIAIRRQSAVKLGGSVSMTYIIGTLSGFFGPFPSFYFVGKENVFLFSSGLMLRVLLGYFFFYGIFQIYKKRNYVLLPLGVFTILEIISLSAIMEAFELRLNMPHLPFIVVIAIFGIYTRFQESRILQTRIVEYVSVIGLILIILFWAFR